MANKNKIYVIRKKYIPFVREELIAANVTNSNLSGRTIVTDFILKKGTKSLDAICLLCESGFSEDVLILCRTLMELCLRLTYIANGTSVEESEMRAQSFIYDGDRQRLEKIKAFAKLKEQGKCLKWIEEIEAGKPDVYDFTMPKNIERLKKIEDIADALGGELECQYHFIYWSISKHVHPSGLGSHTYTQGVNGDDDASVALALAFTIHFFISQAALGVFDLGRLQSKLENYGREFITISD